MTVSTADHDDYVESTGEDGWHRITDVHDMIKWQYADSPYRVIAYFQEDRGHWRTIFTSWYDSGSHLIRGNLGGGKTGKMKAIAASNQFMEENSNGCPPPKDY